MSKFTVTFEQSEYNVYVDIHLPGVNEEGGVDSRWQSAFRFTLSCSEDWVAKLLVKELRKKFGETVSLIREEEYNCGLRDARVKKENRSDYFSPNFITGLK